MTMLGGVLESRDGCVRCAGVFFFFRKMTPISLEAPKLWVRCPRLFFVLQKNDSHISGSP